MTEDKVLVLFIVVVVILCAGWMAQSIGGHNMGQWYVTDVHGACYTGTVHVDSVRIGTVQVDTPEGTYRLPRESVVRMEQIKEKGEVRP